MKEKYIHIKEYECEFGVCKIVIDNIRTHKKYSDCIIKLINKFNDGGETFFGFHRTDGLNLTSKREKELKIKIPLLFKEGSFEKISEFLSVAKTKVYANICNCVPSIFDYFLETVLFNPKIDWETFEKQFSNYQTYELYNFILKGYTDILFFYFDSGDLAIYFDCKKYSFEDVENVICEIFDMHI